MTAPLSRKLTATECAVHGCTAEVGCEAYLPNFGGWTPYCFEHGDYPFKGGYTVRKIVKKEAA